MTQLTRWDPFREMMSLRNAMDQLFESAFVSPMFGWLQPSPWGFAMDVSENDDEFLVKATLPGINPDDLEITLDNNVLTIKGEVKEEKESEERRYHLRERRYGKFSRSFSLPSWVDAEHIDAQYENGILTLRLPKVEEAKPKRIKVKSGEPQKMIEGKATDITSKN